ncbi:MAG TPA: ferritin-like domain-containing protein [Thermoanaerobaculia bacterium]|nr:ferritin-like domain-containing protein [Thermoanaerobaculia bacterium]
MARDHYDTPAVLRQLNRILEAELAGVVRYTHFSFMVFGLHRIAVVQWLRSQASESLLHATEAGEMITSLGGHPSLGIGPLLDTHRNDPADLLANALEHETMALDLYRGLIRLVEGKSVMLEEYARKMIGTEEAHVGEVRKMLRGREAPAPAAPKRRK